MRKKISAELKAKVALGALKGLKTMNEIASMYEVLRTSHHIDSSEYGIDGGKKIKGRKEHIIVDTLGLPMAAKVHATNIHDSVGAVEPIKQLRYIFPRLKKIIADGGYRGKLADTVKDFGWELSVVLRPDESSKKIGNSSEMDYRKNFLMD